ncbi:MAG: FlgD immunoglobulin-like domain containing protein [Candidatus Eisenbacteria bacterium]|uniref:T9SS type A sorting domain-containing protein n=1 Tax=Eiseniibacteriota bacterium TaxID=2212470 RepID=A0A956RMJ3_UNCEI|nr:T9SS type A sorting domain-containing protein [Candidatus Eisenbacteria bacterium]
MSRSVQSTLRESHVLTGRNRPAARAVRRPRLGICLAALAIAVTLAQSARADVPPFAEEWFVPSLPQDVQTDPFGRIWASCLDDTIRVFAPMGGELLFAFGGTGSGDGEFQTPDGIAFDAAGNAYVCDYAGVRIEVFDSAGQFLWSFPTAGTRADHVDLDADGNIYVTGYDDFSVHKYAPDGTPVLDWVSVAGSRTGGIRVINGIVYVVLWDIAEVEQYDTDGNYLGSFASFTTLGLDIEPDGLGRVYVTSYGDGTVYQFAEDGTFLDVLGTLGSGPGDFDGPTGLALGLDGSIYVADQNNGRIERFGAPVASAPGDASTMVPTFRVSPNPAPAGVELRFATARPDELRLDITDVAGRRVSSTSLGRLGIGDHRIEWNPRDASGERLEAGVYFLRIVGGGSLQTSRIVLSR